MHKILALDLDGTLALVGHGTPQECVLKLHELEEMGYRLVICSGKGADYLSGYLRQIDLKDPVVIGENGGVIQYGGGNYPPSKAVSLSLTEEEKKQTRYVVEIIRERFGEEIWFQPNTLVVNPFFRSEEQREPMAELLEREKEHLNLLNIFQHPDCLDILPKGINKYNGLAHFAELEGLEAKDFIAVGDGPNDVAMFRFADVAISVRGKIREHSDRDFDTLYEALDYISGEKL